MTGAARTDSGVHAMNFIAHFDSLTGDIDSNTDLRRKLNSFLPYDISVHDIFQVDNGCHARYDAVSRTYNYLISTVKNPFLREFSHYVFWNIDTGAMNEACGIIKKHTDFTSFSKLHSNNKTNLCRITEAEWVIRENGVLIFRITSNRFLRGMVRALTGTMLDIGSGKMPYQEIEVILSKKNRGAAGMSAPAAGLFLTDISYKDHGPWPLVQGPFSNLIH